MFPKRRHFLFELIASHHSPNKFSPAIWCSPRCVFYPNSNSHFNLTSLSGLKKVNIEKVHVVTFLFHGDGIDVVGVMCAMCASQVGLRAMCVDRRRIRAMCVFCNVELCAMCTTPTKGHVQCVCSHFRVFYSVIIQSSVYSSARYPRGLWMQKSEATRFSFGRSLECLALPEVRSRTPAQAAQ